jgi:mRNA-degrading endonuclease RelE of RelBE toxin-antitoxin system
VYKDEYHPQVKKDLKSLDYSVIKRVEKAHIDNILRDPFKFEKLSGNLNGIYSYHFKEN